MKLMDWIDRQPARVGFGSFKGGGGTAPVSDPRTEGLPPPPDILAPPDFESRTLVETTDIDPSITFVRTAGFYVAGDGGGGIYARRTIEPPHNLWIQSNDGAFWELVLENGIVTEKQAGGVGDGVADDTQAIQSAIDYVLYNDGTTQGAISAEVLIVGPLCRTTDTIHLGYGATFHGVTVRGNARRRRGGAATTPVPPSFRTSPTARSSRSRARGRRSCATSGWKVRWISVDSTSTASTSPRNPSGMRWAAMRATTLTSGS